MNFQNLFLPQVVETTRRWKNRKFLWITKLCLNKKRYNRKLFLNISVF